MTTKPTNPSSIYMKSYRVVVWYPSLPVRDTAVRLVAALDISAAITDVLATLPTGSKVVSASER